MRFKVQTGFLLLLVIATSSVAGNVQDAAKANPSDVAQAERFLTEFPAACSASYAYASTNGTVNIRIICKGSGKSMDGLVSIKNGVVTKIR